MNSFQFLQQVVERYFLLQDLSVLFSFVSLHVTGIPIEELQVIANLHDCLLHGISR